MTDLRIIDRLLSPLRQPREPIAKQSAIPISKHLDDVEQCIKGIVSGSSDVACRRLEVGSKRVSVLLFFLKGMTDEVSIQDYILRPLLHYREAPVQAEILQKTVLEVRETSSTDDLNGAIAQMLRGKVVLFIEGSTQAIVMDARQYFGRVTEEPEAETTVTGPRDGFVENVERNLALIRKRLPTPELKSRQMHLGLNTHTDVAVCYMADRITPELLSEVMQRLEQLQQLDFPDVMDTSIIAEAIEDHPGSPFPQTMETERPDRTVANLLEGRVCILMDGTPKALIIPAALPDMFQSPEDYYQRPLAAAIARWLRYVAAFLTTTSSAIYVAVLTFHYEVIPQRLVVSVARNRALVPFTSIFEALVLEAAAELLREATNRLPSTVGQVIGVVGALVLGQSAVQANLISPLLVIVVAISTISSFAIPNNPGAIALRLMRFPMILAAGYL